MYQHPRTEACQTLTGVKKQTGLPKLSQFAIYYRKKQTSVTGRYHGYVLSHRARTLHKAIKGFVEKANLFQQLLNDLEITRPSQKLPEGAFENFNNRVLAKIK